MRTYNVCCDVEQQDDGSFKLLIKITGLDLSQAQQIADEAKGPLQRICLNVLTDNKGGIQ